MGHKSLFDVGNVIVGFEPIVALSLISIKIFQASSISTHGLRIFFIIIKSN